MPNEYGSRPCCRLINTALARGARPARLRRTAAAHRVPPRRRSRTRRCGGVLGAQRRQLAPHRNKAAALCRPNASLCCHLRSLLVLIDTIGATSPPPSPQNIITSPSHPRLSPLLTHSPSRCSFKQVERLKRLRLLLKVKWLFKRADHLTPPPRLLLGAGSD